MFIMGKIENIENTDFMDSLKKLKFFIYICFIRK